MPKLSCALVLSILLADASLAVDPAATRAPVAAAAAAQHAAVTRPASQLRVMSFNLRVPFRLDGFNYWEHRKQELVQTICQFQPDLLGTQECVNAQAWYLFENLPNYGFHGVGRDDGNTKGEMTAIFFRADKFRKLAGGHFWLSEEPHEVGSKGWDAWWRRMCSWVRLESIADGRQFVFFNAHFDSNGDDARYHSAVLLRRKIDEIAGGLPAVVSGDFNCGEGSKPYNTLIAGPTLREERLIDTYREAHPRRSEHEGTRHGFDGSTHGERIDWIITTQGFDTAWAGIDHTRFGGRYPSDHFPVTAILRWNAAEAAARAASVRDRAASAARPTTGG